MKTIRISTSILALVLLLSACSKNDDPAPVAEATNQQVLDDYVSSIVLPNLKDLNDHAILLNDAIEAFVTDRDDTHLLAARQSWYSTRVAWEQSEAMLFGPVEDNNFDPRIDSWPVDFNAIQTVWNGSEEFTQPFINGLADELKGFHPIEYILFGENGDAKPDDFTDPRKIKYLQAMSMNLKRITDSLYQDWSPSAGNFGKNLLEAGTADSKYVTKQAAFIEIARAMIAIISEVGDSKLKQPFQEQDPKQAESPFSKNSFTDFKNNITGAENVYLGRYGGHQGAGLSNFVATYNKSLDTRIRKQLQEVISNLDSYEVSYGDAIVHHRSQVQASMSLLENLNNTLEQELIPLIKLHVN